MKIATLFFFASTLLFCGCAETSDSGGRDQVSSIPWNRPEKWEGQGMTPGFSGTQ